MIPITYVKLHRGKVISSIQKSIIELGQLGLSETCKWLGELLMSVGGSVNNIPREKNIFSPSATYLFAKSLFDCREYLRCAVTLKQTKNENVHEKFLHYYSYYLAGEIERQSRDFENDGDLNKNPYVRDKILVPLESTIEGESAFLKYLYGVVLVQLSKPREGLKYLMQSVLEYPTLWCAWREIVKCLDGDDKEFCALKLHSFFQTNAQSAQNQQSKHYSHTHVVLYCFFVLDVHIEFHRFDDGLLALFKYLKSYFPNSPYLESQWGMYQWKTGDAAFAVDTFKKLHKNFPMRIEKMDEYANLLFTQCNKRELSMLAHEVHAHNKYSVEACIIVGNYYSLKRNHTKAVEYFQRALKLDPTYSDALTLVGHEYVEMSNTTNAVHMYRRAVDINPRDFQAWYGLGQTYELLKMNQFASYYYQKACVLQEDDSRMWCGLAHCFEQLERFEDAIRTYERAYRAGDPEGVALTRLALLYRRLKNDKMAAKYYMILLTCLEKHTDDMLLYDANKFPKARELIKTTTQMIEQLSPPKKEHDERYMDNIRSKSMTGRDTFDANYTVEVVKTKAILFLVEYFHKIEDTENLAKYVKMLQVLKNHENISDELKRKAKTLLNQISS